MKKDYIALLFVNDKKVWSFSHAANLRIAKTSARKEALVRALVDADQKQMRICEGYLIHIEPLNNLEKLIKRNKVIYKIVP